MKPEMKSVHPIAQHLLEAGHRLGQRKKPEFKTPGQDCVGTWLLRVCTNRQSVRRGDIHSPLSDHAPNSWALWDWGAETATGLGGRWSAGGKGRAEDEEELGRKENKARGVGNMLRKCTGQKQLPPNTI